MFLAPEKTTNTSMVELIALVVVIALGSWFFVRPQMATLKDSRAQLRQAETAYARVEEDKAELIRLSNQLKRSQADIVLVDEALPLQNRPTHVQVLLEGLAGAAGMTISSMDVQPAEKNIVAGDKTTLKDSYGVVRKVEPIVIELKVTGSIEQFKDLLQLIESNGRVVDITNFDMVDDQGNPTFKLKLKAYSYVP